ncbi:MAG: hypothetical protein H6670_02645 [Anaerolineaceae bacterium]|nr:hypothetical protein [Anaerolineaceae bacterium]
MPEAIFSQHKTKLSTRNSALKSATKLFLLLAAKYGSKWPFSPGIAPNHADISQEKAHFSALYGNKKRTFRRRIALLCAKL